MYKVTFDFSDEVEFFDDASTVAEHIVETLDEDEYDAWLNDIYGSVNVCGYEFDAAEALYELDRIAYNVGFDDFRDSELSDIEYSIERLDIGENDWFYGYTIEFINDEELSA